MDPELEKLADARLRKFIAALLAERTIQDTIWGGPAHDNTHSPVDWVNLIQERTARIQVLPVNTVERRAKYYRLMIEIAALAAASYQAAMEF